MVRNFIISAALAISLPTICMAEVDDPDIVRLPGTGIAKHEAPQGLAGQRLAPGGGLILSFDANDDASITVSELAAGIEAAFIAADANGDGALSALEQQAWASSLPTFDDSLANPVQFDPNLDRIISPEEFTSRIQSIAAVYRAEGHADIALSDLRAPAPDRPPRNGPGRPDGERRQSN